MNKFTSFRFLLLALFLHPHAAQDASCEESCVFRFPVNVEGNGFMQTLTNTTIVLSNVTVISSIEIDIASEYGEDLTIIMTPVNGGAQEEYVLMKDTVATENTGSGDLEDFDMGNVAGDGSLSNVGPYVFVDTGGLAGFTAPFSPPGLFNADSWGSGIYNGGKWNFIIQDVARGDVSSIGTVTLKYCARSCDANAFPSGDDDVIPSTNMPPTSSPIMTTEPTLDNRPSSAPTSETLPTLETEPTTAATISDEFCGSLFNGWLDCVRNNGVCAACAEEPSDGMNGLFLLPGECDADLLSWFDNAVTCCVAPSRGSSVDLPCQNELNDFKYCKECPSTSPPSPVPDVSVPESTPRPSTALNTTPEPTRPGADENTDASTPEPNLQPTGFPTDISDRPSEPTAGAQSTDSSNALSSPIHFGCCLIWILLL